MLRILIVSSLCVLAACKSGPEAAPTGSPEISSIELSLPEQELSDFSARIDGQVQSPRAVTIDKATYELVVDEKVVKNGEVAIGTQVPAGGAAPFHLQVRGAYPTPTEGADGGTPLGSVLTALRGKLILSEAGRPFSLDFAKSREVRLPAQPMVVMNQVDFARFSTDEAGGTFYVGVKNPNPFTIHLSSLSWTAVINGKQVGEGELGKGEQVSPASTGVFEVQLSVNQETYGPEVGKLIQTKTLPYDLKGELVARMFKTPYELKGDIKLNVSK